jgi:hypothetical protein
MLASVVLLLVTSCSSGIAGPLGQAAKDASSATASLALALRLEAEGKATDALAGTTAEDMVTQAVAAYKQAAEQAPADGTELVRQQEVLQALDQALRSLQQARLAQDSGNEAARRAAAADLQRQARELSRLGSELRP